MNQSAVISFLVNENSVSLMNVFMWRGNEVCF